MRTEIYLPFLLSAVFAVLSRRVCRRTSPPAAAWSVTLAMALLAGSAMAALGLLTWPLVARLPVVAHLGDWRPGAVNHGVPADQRTSTGTPGPVGAGARLLHPVVVRRGRGAS